MFAPNLVISSSYTSSMSVRVRGRLTHAVNEAYVCLFMGL